MPDGMMQLCLTAHWSGTSIEDITAGLSKCNRHTCWHSPTTTNVFANLTEMHACIRCAKWPGATVTNMPAVSEQSLKTWVLQQA